MLAGILSHGAYFACVVLLTMLVPGSLLHHERAAQAVLILGVLGTWRYSWAALNFARAALFHWWVHPRRKRAAQARFAAAGAPSHCFFLVTTYMVDPEATIACYRALFRAASRARDGATVVVSVCDGADERLIRSLYDASPDDLSNVRLLIDRIRPNGKRDALAQSLRLIAAMSPTPHDVCVFVDGDTCVPEDVWAEAAPVFSDPKVGALTTDEGVIIEKDNLFRDWFVLRFNQRQVMMCSMGLSRRVLTLTGRMSAFRATLCTDPGFIAQVGHDHLDHWRLGRVTFLTGDDKSTWFWLLKNGHEMVYLPDVRSWSMETQPRPTFLESSKVLMVRWFGNMMRTNGRALRLPPSLIGGFTWWSILDQRVSMWTTLVGPVSVALAALWTGPAIIPLYLAWVMVTRYAFCAVMSAFRGTWFPVTHPPILYFGQVAGAAVKTFVLFRLDKQKWTRQGAGSGAARLSLAQRMGQWDSLAHHAIALAWLTLAVILLAMI